MTARLMRWGSLALAASFLFFLRGDLRYAFQPKKPVDLGGPLEFNLSREGNQRYARIEGVPGDEAANVTEMGSRLRLFGLLGTNVVVVQNADRNKLPTKGAPFSATGRLVRDDDAGAFRHIFEMLEAQGAVFRDHGHLYALFAGQAPRQGWTLPLEFLGMVLFVLANFWAARRLERPPRTLEI